MLKVEARGDREIVMTETLAAPRSRVFEAWTRPDLLKRWLGPRSHAFAVCEIDLKPGGGYRWVWRGPDGSEMGMGGVYREIAPPERIVATEKFDNWYPGEGIVTTTLAEDRGKTTVTTTVRYPSPEIRDMVLASPMRQGVAESYERIAELLAGRS